jgi:hypothetical protein
MKQIVDGLEVDVSNKKKVRCWIKPIHVDLSIIHPTAREINYKIPCLTIRNKPYNTV